MAYFPFMIQLDDKKCLVAGGGKVAFRKVTQMLSFGAEVIVVAPEICDDILKIESNRLIILKRRISEKDIDDKDVVILATDDCEVNATYAELCKKKRILVNVVDVKQDCGFYFPAIVKQDEVVIAVSTGGSSPLLASEIKKDINQFIRDDYGKIARELEPVREYALKNISGEDERKEYLKNDLRKRLQ